MAPTVPICISRPQSPVHVSQDLPLSTLAVLPSPEHILIYVRYQNQEKSSQKCTSKPSHQFRIPLIIILRITGKSIAFINALWIILFSMAEYIGLFNNCWCLANSVTAGAKGWVMIFKSAAELKDAASGVWIGAIFIEMVVCVVALLYFVLGSRQSGWKDD